MRLKRAMKKVEKARQNKNYQDRPLSKRGRMFLEAVVVIDEMLEEKNK